GDRALGQFAPDEAIRWYVQALELTDHAPDADPRQRIELLLGLGIAQHQTGNAAHRETLLDAAHQADQHGQIDLLVRAVLANNRGWASRMGDTDHERLEVIDRALKQLDAT